eukprot:7886982-Pyramimonas_sp.AAC.1
MRLATRILTRRRRTRRRGPFGIPSKPTGGPSTRRPRKGAPWAAAGPEPSRRRSSKTARGCP